MSDKQRQGVLVKPVERLSKKQVELIDRVSRELLEDPGLICHNQRAAGLFKDAGAKVEDLESGVRVRIPASVLDKGIENAPEKVVLGARDPDNRLILDAGEPRVRFGSGSETNTWVVVEFEGADPRFKRVPGSIELLGKAAHLCDDLENLDFFIRCVNIQDPEVTEDNKDANMFLISLHNINKHVMAGLTKLEALDDVVGLGYVVAGGEEAFKENPVLSFITCVIKSPLEMVDDTAEKMIEIAGRRVPVVISSSPMAGATAPFDEFGIVAQINAEILAGITLAQLVSPGTPVLYGSVPVRTRLDNLNDMYGAPEFNHFNLDCAQMARFYGVPCYSTAGVADIDVPGIQATAEKMLTVCTVPRGGAQYIHYAFGLLERTGTFCPEQAVLDNAHIGIVKRMFREPPVSDERSDEILALVREVMESSHRTYMYHLPMPTREDVYVRYPLEDKDGGALLAAHKKYRERLEQPRDHLPKEVLDEVKAKVPGILDKSLKQ